MRRSRILVLSAGWLLLVVGSAPAAEQPGSPCAAQSFSQDVREDPDPVERCVRAVPPVSVNTGYLILVETALADSLDSRKWSDVLVFNDDVVPVPAGCGAFADLVSDPNENGITTLPCFP